MGYYTKYTLKVEPTSLEEEIRRVLTSREGASPFVEDTYDKEGSKWYYWYADCIAASSRYPSARITVEYTGEEDGDGGTAVFLGGVAQSLTGPRWATHMKRGD